MNNSISAIILASGLSKRFGTNKLLIDIDGKNLFEHTLLKLKKIEFDEIIVIFTNSIIDDICKKHNIKHFYNNYAEKGQGTSVSLGVKKANVNNDYMFFVSDMPYLTTLTINNLINSFYDTRKITRPICNNIPGNPVIFPNSFRNELIELNEDKGGMSIVKNKTSINMVEIKNHKELFDIDTKSDYEKFMADRK